MTTRNETMHLLSNIRCSFIDPISSIFKGCLEFLVKYKKRALAVLFLALEAISTVLDIIGKDRLSFVGVALVLSVIGFCMTVCTCSIERTRLQSERQLRTVDIVSSTAQLIVAIVHFIMVILGSNYNFGLQFFPLVFAIINVAFVFQKNEQNIRSRSRLRSNSTSISTLGQSSSTPNESTSRHASRTPDESEDLISLDLEENEENLTGYIGIANLRIRSN